MHFPSAVNQHDGLVGRGFREIVGVKPRSVVTRLLRASITTFDTDAEDQTSRFAGGVAGVVAWLAGLLFVSMLGTKEDFG